MGRDINAVKYAASLNASWDKRDLEMRGLPGHSPLAYQLRELEVGPSQHAYFGLWFNVGEQGECFFHGSCN